MGDALQIASTILLAFSAVLAWISIRKYRNSRGVDFVIEAEGAIDPLYQRMVGAKPELIRSAYRGFEIEKLSDADCRVFPFMHLVYSQVSRMYFILSARRLDYGLDGPLREEMIRSWLKELEQYRDHPAMIAMHRHAVRTSNFNSAFLQIASEIFDYAGSDNSRNGRTVGQRRSDPDPPELT